LLWHINGSFSAGAGHSDSLWVVLHLRGFREMAPFAVQLTPQTIAIAARTLSTDSELQAELG
jgi:hypothetical protein